MSDKSCSSPDTKFAKHALWFAVYLFLYLLVNFYVLTRPSFHWDEILDWSGQATDTYLVAGRWGCYAYRNFMGEGSFPIVSGLMAGVYISLALLLQTSLLKLSSVLQKLLYAAFYIACNQWASQLIYSFQSDTVALGLLFATTSVYALLRWNKPFVAVAILILALGMYQSIALYFGVLWAAVCLLQEDIRFSRFFPLLAVSVSGVAVYFVVQKLCLLFIPVSRETMEYVTLYQTTTTDWDFVLKGTWLTVLQGAQHYFRMSLAHAFGFGNHWNPVITSAFLPMILLGFRYMRSGLGIVSKLYKLMLLLIVWYAPYVLTFLMLGFPGERVWVAAPLSVAALWILVLREYAASVRVWYVLVAFSLTMVLKAVYFNAVIARCEAYTYHTSIQHLQQIYSEACRTAAAAGMELKEVLLVPESPEQNNPAAYQLSSSFRSGVLLWFSSHYQWKGMRWATDAENEKYRDEMVLIPCWPDFRSVKVTDGRILVKVAKVLK